VRDRKPSFSPTIACQAQPLLLESMHTIDRTYTYTGPNRNTY
jgi:hypothetical protein